MYHSLHGLVAFVAVTIVAIAVAGYESGKGLFSEIDGKVETAIAEYEYECPRNGPADALRHCIAGCIVKKELGEKPARVLAWGREVWGDTKGQLEGERLMDEHNNEYGFVVADRDEGDCAKKCHRISSNFSTLIKECEQSQY